jgi:hypothetical protein
MGEETPPHQATRKEGIKMARTKKIEGEQTLTSEEVALMRQEIADLKLKVRSQKADPYEEIRKASIKNQQGSQQIAIRHFTDHKKAALYHTNGFHIGKKIGPLHPGLLDYTFTVFKNKGITLSITCPTQEEIEAYKTTQEFKDAEEAQKRNKPHRYKKQTPDETQRIIAQFAKVIGVPSNEAVQMKPQPAGV